MISENKTQEKLFPISLLFFIDAVLTACSFIVSYALCSFILEDINAHSMLIQLPIVVSLTCIIFLFIGIYKGIVNTNRLNEVYSIFNAICLANILTIVLVVVNGKLILEENLMVPLAIIIVHSILSFSALVASRFLYKNLVVKLIRNYSVLKNILLIHDLPSNNENISLLENNFFSRKKKIVSSLSTTSKDFKTEISTIESNQKSFDEIHLYQHNSSRDNLWDVIPSLLKFNKAIYISSDVGFNSDLDSESLTAKRIFKRLSLPDLFPQRVKSKKIFSDFSNDYNGKTILVTGAGGCIASEFLKELFNSEVKAKFILLDNSETALAEVVTFMKNSKNIKVIPKLLDLKEKKSLEKLFSIYNISLVLHTAGNNSPEGLNETISKVMQENLIATKLLADISKRNGVEKFIFCSTSGADCPRTTLEVSKRLAEVYLYSLNTPENKTNFISIRLNRVYDTNGSGLKYMKSQIEFEKPINRSYFSEKEMYSGKRDVAKALLVLCADKSPFVNSILTFNIGISVATELLAEVILHLNLRAQGNGKIKEVSFIDSFKNGSLIHNESMFKINEDSNRLFKVETDLMPDFSKFQIQQKVENLCINLLFDQDDVSLVFDLINNFNSDQWENLCKLQQQKPNQTRIIKLQSK